MAVSSREKAGQRAACPIQSLALETHWGASAALSIASSAAGTKRTRSCSPAALPSPAGGWFIFLLGVAAGLFFAVNREHNLVESNGINAG
jgi:hypothetical protein